MPRSQGSRLNPTMRGSMAPVRRSPSLASSLAASAAARSPRFRCAWESAPVMQTRIGLSALPISARAVSILATNSSALPRAQGRGRKRQAGAREHRRLRSSGRAPPPPRMRRPRRRGHSSPPPEGKELTAGHDAPADEIRRALHAAEQLAHVTPVFYRLARVARPDPEGSAAPELGRQLRLARGLVVEGSEPGQLVSTRPHAPLENARHFLVHAAPMLRELRLVCDLLGERMPEGICRLSVGGVLDDEPVGDRRERLPRSGSSAAPVRRASTMTENSRPMTAAAWSTWRSDSWRRSMRELRTAWMVGGSSTGVTRSSASYAPRRPTRRPRWTIDWTSSSMKNGFPPARARTCSPRAVTEES